MTVPATKVARQALIAELLAGHTVRSQPQLRDLLADRGLDVTQATVSRDLDELGAVRLRGDDGHLVYAVPGDGQSEAAAGRVERVLTDLLVSVDHSANLVVVRTPPGGAQLLASTIDHGDVPGVIGTVAGDDTVLLVTRAPDGGAGAARWLLDKVQAPR